MRLIKLEIREDEVDALIEHGLLDAREREDPMAITSAIGVLLDAAFPALHDGVLRIDLWLCFHLFPPAGRPIYIVDHRACSSRPRSAMYVASFLRIPSSRFVAHLSIWAAEAMLPVLLDAVRWLR